MIRMTAAQARLFDLNTRRNPSAAASPDFSVAPKPKRRREDLPENIVKNQVIQFLQIRGWTVTRQHVGTYAPYRILLPLCEAIRAGANMNLELDKSKRNIVRIGHKGDADWRAEKRTAGLQHFVIYLEFKRPGKKPDPHQLQWLLEKQLMGTPADWFDSFDVGRKPFLGWYRKHFEPDYPKSHSELKQEEENGW